MAEKLAATNEEAFNFASYMKERAQLVNEALDKSVPLQYPEIINESMRQAYAAVTQQFLTPWEPCEGSDQGPPWSPCRLLWTADTCLTEEHR